MILVNCAWRQDDIRKNVEDILIKGEKNFKLVKTEGIRMFFESKIANNEKSMKLIKKAIKQINGYQALVINIVPVIDGSVFKGYTETVCKTIGNAKSRNNI